LAGSFDANADRAAWGVVHRSPNTTAFTFRCGPISVCHRVAGAGTAHRKSNNTAELAAITSASAWCLEMAATTSMVPQPRFLYDSTWAANVTRGIWRPRCNPYEADQARRGLEQLRDAGVHPTFHHVRSHLGHHLNEMADLAAKLGATGVSHLNGTHNLLREPSLANLMPRTTTPQGGGHNEGGLFRPPPPRKNAASATRTRHLLLTCQWTPTPLRLRSQWTWTTSMTRRMSLTFLWASRPILSHNGWLSLRAADPLSSTTDHQG